MIHLGLGIKSKILYNIKKSFAFIKNGFKFKTILFYPKPLAPVSTLHKISYYNYYKITNNFNSSYHIAINWNWETFIKNPIELNELSKKIKVININCTDVSKTKVAKLNNEVFNNKFYLDPTKHKGNCVKKIEDNGLHDSTIIKCPIRKEEIEENYTYQKLVNNRVDEKYLEELRIPIINYKMIIILVKYRFHADQFDQEANQKAEIKFPKQVFNDTEIKKIELFCEKMNFEVGEIDILRDQDNKMIYIVDTNNTPSFAGDGYNRSGKNKIIKILSKEFHNQYIKNI